MAQFDAVNIDFNFTVYDSLEDIPRESGILCIIKKTEGYHCRTYSHYSAEVVDINGLPSAVNYHGYVFSSFRITGQAADYCLKLEFRDPLGHSRIREFRSDISFGHHGEGYSRIKDEWSVLSQYKSIFEYFDNLIKYGEEAYELILKYEREAYANDAAYRQERDRFKAFQEEMKAYRDCVKELYFPEEWTSIPYGFYYSDGVERIFIPSSITLIPRIPSMSSLKQIFCFAEKPPVIGDTRFLSDRGVHLYVPKDSVELYKDNKDWSTAFTIINGI